MPNAYDAIAEVMAERFGAIDTKLAEKVRNPLTCPAHLLGHLAWSRGLDYWDSSWSESVKRQLILLTPANLRIRGTRRAINNALAAFAADLTVEEWWEQDPEGTPGTGIATIALGADIGVDVDAQALIVLLLSRESRKSMHWELALGVGGFCAIGDEARARVTTLYQYSGEQTGA